MIQKILVQCLRIAAVCVAVGFLIAYTLYASGNLTLWAGEPAPAGQGDQTVMPSSKKAAEPLVSVHPAEGGAVPLDQPVALTTGTPPATPTPTATPLVVLPSSKAFIAHPLNPAQSDVSLDQPVKVALPSATPVPMRPAVPGIISGSKSGVLHPIPESTGTIILSGKPSPSSTP